MPSKRNVRSTSREKQVSQAAQKVTLSITSSSSQRPAGSAGSSTTGNGVYLRNQAKVGKRESRERTSLGSGSTVAVGNSAGGHKGLGAASIASTKVSEKGSSEEKRRLEESSRLLKDETSSFNTAGPAMQDRTASGHSGNDAITIEKKEPEPEDSSHFVRPTELRFESIQPEETHASHREDQATKNSDNTSKQEEEKAEVSSASS